MQNQGTHEFFFFPKEQKNPIKKRKKNNKNLQHLVVTIEQPWIDLNVESARHFDLTSKEKGCTQAVGRLNATKPYSDLLKQSTQSYPSLSVILINNTYQHHWILKPNKLKWLHITRIDQFLWPETFIDRQSRPTISSNSNATVDDNKEHIPVYALPSQSTKRHLLHSPWE